MLVRNFFSLLILFSSVHMLLIPSRFLLGFNPNFFILVIYLFFSIFIFIQVVLKKYFFYITKTEFMLIIIPFILIPISILNGYINHHMLSDIIKPFLFITVILYFKSVDLDFLLKSKNIKKIMVIFFIFSVISALVLILFYITKGGFYLSATSTLILIPIFYFYFSKRYIFLFTGLLVILNAGKRAVLLSFGGSFLFLFLSKIKNIKQFILYILVLLVFLFFIIVYILLVIWNIF